MNTTEMVVLFVVGLMLCSTLLIPLFYAAVLDGRYNDEQQRLAAGGTTPRPRLVSSALPSRTAFGTNT